MQESLEGKLTKDAYQSQKAQIITATQDVAEQFSALESQSENIPDCVGSHKLFFGQASLTREILQGLIKEIRVTSADEIEVVWKYQDFYQGLQRLVL